MLANKLKLVHDEYDTLHLSPLRHNRKSYPREENNCGDDYIMFITDDGHMCDTVISNNTYLSRNKNSKIIDSVLSHINIYGAKCKIYSGKT